MIRRRLAMAAGALAAMALAASVGRWTAPARVETRETVREVAKVVESAELRQEVERLRTRLSERAQAKNVVTVREVIRAPDGTVIERERTRDRTRTERRTSTEATSTAKTEAKTERTAEVTRVEERIRVVDRPSPTWAAGVGLGGHVPALWGGGAPSYLPGLPAALVVTGALDRRLFGPVYGGVWGSSRGDAGVGVRVSW